MVFVGNINQSVDVLLKTSHLFEPFPEAMAYDTAFQIVWHCYIPRLKYQNTEDLISLVTSTDLLLTTFLNSCVKCGKNSLEMCDKYFKFGSNLNQRDAIAVRKMVSGFAKLLYPNGEYSKEEIQEIITISLELRRRVKEQLKKIGGMEFYDVNFSYIDNDSFEEFYVSVPEQGGGKLISRRNDQSRPCIYNLKRQDRNGWCIPS